MKLLLLTIGSVVAVIKVNPYPFLSKSVNPLIDTQTVELETLEDAGEEIHEGKSWDEYKESRPLESDCDIDEQ